MQNELSTLGLEANESCERHGEGRSSGCGILVPEDLILKPDGRKCKADMRCCLKELGSRLEASHCFSVKTADDGM